jgi:hypothetical protein
LTEYLDAEKRLDRIAAATDTAMLAFTVFASAHQLFLSNPDHSNADHPVGRDGIEQVLRSLLAGVTTD